ncbi:pilus assembly protein CpaE [Arsenicicoccus piscis]|uniref:Pilus assembly protein CpaE n=1 Tax=Arsenicicoccus piscis TaxID=673954 RepID=A0ABQ6HRR5_9MICO|nr:pilus assembly protein CpaE [Arsenicicoccus piscis]MCH8629339.1 pilus assembly protein CpaE [Arsenicicoccus piscis]GMA20399.1 hypothetical protein GCM10025862_24200 [Arsenicicoccus piscis]
MLTVELATELLSAGLLWEPAPGDRFIVAERDMDDQVFVLSDMTIEVHEFPKGREIGFNGVTEWALDSVEMTDVLWLPREEQLRAALGDRFRSLWQDQGEWVVAIEIGGVDPQPSSHTDTDAECAYARAVLHMLHSDSGSEDGPDPL